MFKQEITIKDGRKLIVKEAVGSEAKELVRYIAAVGGESDFLTFGANEFNVSVKEEEALLKTFLESDNQIMLVGWLQNEIVGCIAFRAGKWLRVRHSGEFGISVSKKYWGMGIGSHMLSVLIAWAQQTGIVRKINLRVRSDNDRAIAVYKKLGFVQEGVITREFMIDGEFYDNIWFGLALDEI